MRRPAALALVAVGFLSMLGQVALLRELAVASFGVELVFVIGTALWLAAGAVGALVGGGRRGAGGAAVSAGLLVLSLLLPPEAVFLRGARQVFGGVPGAYLPLGQQVATAALGVMPAGALLGWLFRRGAADLAAAGGSLASAYAWESLGGVLGSVVATATLAAGVPNLSLVLAAGAAGALVAARHARARPWAAAAAVALAALLPLAPSLDRLSTAWNHPGLTLVADTPYGRLAVVESHGQVAVFENGALAWDSEETGAEALVHPAALQVREGARVLVLEGSAAGLVREALKHRPARVVAVEPGEAAYRALRPRLPRAEQDALSAPAVELRFEDPRAFLRTGTDPFDLLLLGAPEPASGQSNRFYTVEFFRRCAARLAPGGVLALRLPSSENLWTPGLLMRNGAVHAALRAAFADVLVLPGSTDVMLASASPLERDPGRLGDRLRTRGIAVREVTPDYLRWLLTNDRAGTVAGLLAEAAVPANSDARPVCYQQTALLWLGRLTGGAGQARLPGLSTALAVLGALAALALAARGWRAARGPALVGAAALVGMVLEAVVLLRYQAEVGALYRDVGLLLTSFMAGLVLGAAAFDRARARHGPARRWWAVIPVAGLALLAVALAASIRASLAAGLATSSAFLCGAGVMVATVFAAAGRPGAGARAVDPAGPGGAAAPGAETEGAGATGAGPLYAADLIGGCAGSLLAAGLLVPVLGTDGTALAATGLALAALLLVP